MRKFLCAGLAAAAMLTATPMPAKAYGGFGFGFGLGVGVGAGVVLGTTIARPYPYGYYPYGYAPYGYYAPAYPAVVPYPHAYGYPPPVVAYAPPPVYGLPPGVYLPPVNPSAGVVQTVPATAAQSRMCRAGQFFNTLTGNCDRR